MEDEAQPTNSPDVLSPRQRRFVEEYIIDYNATAAYMRAGYRGTRATARRNAHVLLTNTDIDAAIKKAEQAVLERVRFRQHEIYSELRNVALSNIEHYQVDDGGNVSLKHGADESAMRAISSLQKKTTHRTRGDETETTHEVKLTLWNKNDALRMAGQTQGMLTDKHEHSGPNGKPIPLEIEDHREQLARKLEATVQATASNADPQSDEGASD